MSANEPQPRIEWFFDFISPFAYLQWQRIRDRFAGMALRPILFAGLLDRLGQKGPAEIPRKRLFTYRHVAWRARVAGIPMRFPPAHPFNPLPALRLCVAAGSTAGAVDAIFEHIWRFGRPGETSADLEPVARALGMDDATTAVGRQQVKDDLRSNFDRALAHGVFGVPSLVVDGIVFWGEDATDMFAAYLEDRSLFDAPEMARLAMLPIGAARGGA